MNPVDQTQLEKIRELMIDGEWRTLVEIETLTGAPHSSISAQLRHLRKPKYGSWEMLKRLRPYTDGKREYRLLSNDHPQAVEIREARASTAVTKKDFASWRMALRELLVAVSAVNMEDAEGDALMEAPVIEVRDDQQSPVMVSRPAMLEVLRLGFWLKAKVEAG